VVKVLNVRFARFPTEKSVGMRAMAVAIAVLLFDSQQSSLFAAGKPAKVSQIFSSSMLEATVAHFEKIAGPAWKILPGPSIERRIYKVERCEVEATVGIGAIRSLHLKLSDRCTFDLTAVFVTRQRLPTVGRLTFGEVERAIRPGKMAAVCLLPCGKVHHRAVYEHIEGSQADKFIDAILEVRLSDDRSNRAASDWATFMQDDGGKDYVKGTRFNCDDRYDELAHKLFYNVRITAIRIGFNFTEPWQDCN
jgi:hypothetical protein